MSFLKKIFSWLGKLFKKLIKLVKLLPFILLALAVYLAFMTGGLSFLGMTIPAGYASAAIAVGASFLLAPEETKALVDKATNAIGGAAKNIASNVGAVAGSIASGFLESPLGLGLLAFGAWFFFIKDDKPKEEPARVTRTNNDLEAVNG
jgi:hypothetical protein